MVFGRTRGHFYAYRRDLSFLLNKSKVNLKQLNLAHFRVYSDFCFINELTWRIPRVIFPLNEGSRNALVKNILESREVVVYLSFDALEIYLPILHTIYSDFTGIFVLDPRDVELIEKPKWVGPNASWCAPHITNPFNSTGLCLPVGVEELALARNGRLKNLSFQSIKSKRVLVGPFAQTHTSRQEFLDWKSNDIFTVPLKRLSIDKYAIMAGQHQFVICPRGNGVDTHRFWETLYRGSVPIVENTEWAQYFRGHGIPMIIVENFEETKDWTRTYLEATWESISFNPANIPGLWADYWLDLVKSRASNRSANTENSNKDNL